MIAPDKPYIQYVDICNIRGRSANNATSFIGECHFILGSLFGIPRRCGIRLRTWLFIYDCRIRPVVFFHIFAEWGCGGGGFLRCRGVAIVTTSFPDVNVRRVPNFYWPPLLIRPGCYNSSWALPLAMKWNRCAISPVSTVTPHISPLAIALYIPKSCIAIEHWQW